MTRSYVGVAIAAALASGCGDDGTRCGDGTSEIDGVCMPDNRITCGDGTALVNGLCVIATTTCEGGTVLVANRCVDPASELTIDLEESAEPNGLGVADGVESSSVPAGTIQLPSSGTFVVHGHIAPFRDADGDGQPDPDVDSYFVDVAAPVALDISVDGVGGTQGAFYLVDGTNHSATSYRRYGLSLTGDTAHRRVFLPAAGRYILAITDLRSLAIGQAPPPSAGTGAAGGPDAEYYAALTITDLPAPVALSASGGTLSQSATLAPGALAVYTTSLDAGSADFRVAMTASSAATSLAALVDNALAGYANQVAAGAGQPASDAAFSVAGVSAGAHPVVVVDAIFNEGPSPVPFVLTISQPPPP
jgi:hypothetical protein